jgi:hypothetical protein
MTIEKLKSNTRKELAALAKRHRVAGWHGMRKEELIEALLDVHRSRAGESSRSVRSVARIKTERREPNPPEAVKPAPLARPSIKTSPRPAVKSHSQSNGAAIGTAAKGTTSTARPVRRDISTAGPTDAASEELIAVAHDPYWIHARWVLKRSTVLRAEAALGAEWFRAVPVIRVHALDVDETKGVSAAWVRDVEIHGECDHWFVPVEHPPGAFKLEIGYAAPSGRFFALAKSKRVTTPRPGSKAAERLGWNRNGSSGSGMSRTATGRAPVTDPQFEKFLAARAVSYAVSSGDYRSSGHGSGASRTPFQIETELVVSGLVQPNSQLTLQGETIRIGRDGRFSTRVSLGDGRNVIPATSVSADGTEQRTIILAVESNTKELEPQVLDEMH